MRALEVYAGPRALRHLHEQGLRPADVRVVPAAAGGPKGLVLNPLDRFIFGHWLVGSAQTVHLLGASIGAWRMACACADDPAGALAELADDYIGQRYIHRPGRNPEPAHVSAVLGQLLDQRLGRRAAEVLSSPRYRLHVFTSRGRRLLAHQGRLRTPLGYAAAFAANAVSRRALGGWLERVVFADPREALPFALDDYTTRQVALTAENLAPSVQASCSIPFLLDAVSALPGAPAGAYWDGGITDYHLQLDYGRMPQGLVLYPHFRPQLVPGWLDKAWKSRQRAGSRLDNVVVLAPSPAWVASLPQGKLPDRADFMQYIDDDDGRMRAWRRALAESQRLADEFAERVQRGAPFEALPLP